MSGRREGPLRIILQNGCAVEFLENVVRHPSKQVNKEG